MEIAQKKQLKSYFFNGTMEAVTALTVSRPNDKFSSIRGSEDMGRLPRLGAKRDDTPVFFSPNTLRHLIRESAVDMVRRVTTKDISLEACYMLYQGVDINNMVTKESTGGMVGAENALRTENPLLSVFGRWKLPSKFHISAAIPMNGNESVYIEGAGVRKNMFSASPWRMETLKPEDAATVLQMMREDSETSVVKGDIDAQKKDLKQQLRKTNDSDVKSSLNQKINDLDLQLKAAKESKTGSQESIQRPFDGFEAIAPGTMLSHKMRLARASTLELGLFLGALREASHNPIVGGHQALGCGELAARYEVSVFEAGAISPEIIGAVSFGLEQGFIIEGELLVTALADWDTALSTSERFNFTRYLCEEPQNARESAA